MRIKSRQIKPKEFEIVTTELKFMLDNLEVIPCPLMRSVFGESLTNCLTTLANQESTKDSKNSGVPPSKMIKPATPRVKGQGKPGGQQGHEGHTYTGDLTPTETYDITPAGLDNDPNMKQVGEIERFVVDVITKRRIIKFVTRVFENKETGERFSGVFPDAVNAHIQFGDELKAQAVYLREHQHLSYERMSHHFRDLYGIDISEATLVNIIREAEKSPVLDDFEEAARVDFAESYRLNADETSISVGGINFWVHVYVSTMFTYFALHQKRGQEAMRDIGFLPNATGVVVHDGLKSYFLFTNFLHCLCNAHILRELELVIEMGSNNWAELMKEFLLNLHDEVEAYGGQLPLSLQAQAVKRYKEIIAIGLNETGGEQLARPPGQKGKRGRIKKTKGRNLLERLMVFEDAVLRFMTDSRIPFTNNDAERPIRMLKVRAKISGCFKSLEMAKGFCKIRGYLVSCQKNNLSVYHAIKMLIRRQTPEFIQNKIYPAERKAA